MGQPGLALLDHLGLEGCMLKKVNANILSLFITLPSMQLSMQDRGQLIQVA
jgi:hypothetical protein